MHLQRVFKAVKLFSMMLEWWIYDIMHWSKLTEWTIPWVNLNVSYRLWVIMLCQYRCIDFNKCYHTGGRCWYGGGCVYEGGKGIWELSVLPSSQFCCEPKISLKNSHLPQRLKTLPYKVISLESSCENWPIQHFSQI